MPRRITPTWPTSSSAPPAWRSGELSIAAPVRGRGRHQLLERPELCRSILVVALTLVTGATGATSFLKLGGVFTSVMTANIVLLGVSVGRHSTSLAGHVGLAFATYIAGVLLGSAIAGRAQADQSVWPRQVTLALCAELTLFAAFTAGFESADGAPNGALQLTLLALSATALGVQSSAVLRFGVNGLSTTYLTGTLTTLLGSLRYRGKSKEVGRNALILLALVVGGIAGALLSLHAASLEPLLQLGILLVVIAVALGAGLDRSHEGRGAANGGGPSPARQ